MPSGGLEVRFLYSEKRRLAAREVAIVGFGGCGGKGYEGGRVERLEWERGGWSEWVGLEV